MEAIQCMLDFPKEKFLPAKYSSHVVNISISLSQNSGAATYFPPIIMVRVVHPSALIQNVPIYIAHAIPVRMGLIRTRLTHPKQLDKWNEADSDSYDWLSHQTPGFCHL